MSDNGLGPVCDRCGTPLVVHGETFAGQACDLGLALSDLWREILVAVFGPERGWQAWLDWSRSR